MGLANKQHILGNTHWETHTFDVVGWGEVRIRSLSAAQRVAAITMASAMEESDKPAGERAIDFVLAMVAMSVIDENGACMFTDDDLPKLREVDYRKLERIAEVALEFNGMGHKADEEPEKN